MKLQVKDAGAWRNVLSFTGERQQQVEPAAAALLEAAGCEKVAMQILDQGTVVAYFEPSTREWRAR